MEGTMQNVPARGVTWLRILAWTTATCLLLLPAVAMQFTRDVDWSAGDFAVMGAILYGCCALFEVAARMSRNSTPYLAAAILGIGTGFLTVWISLAVGIIDEGHDDANLAFVVVLAIALLGSVAARFRPRGLATAMLAAGIAQGLTALCAAFLESSAGTLVSAIFTVAWLASAALFRRAADALEDS